MSKETTVVVIGSGGAESALVKKYGQSPHVDRIIAIPGNDMMQELVPNKSVDIFPKLKVIEVDEIAELLSPARREIAFVDIRDENALEKGLSGKLWRKNIKSASPSRSAARLEWDKEYARDIAQELQIPQPEYDVLHFPNGKNPKYYDSVVDRYSHSKSFVKANGLAYGKGVIGADNAEEIHQAVQRLRLEYPSATDRIIVERALFGEELSAFGACFGDKFFLMGFAEDHKRALDGDLGVNTGGMGAVNNPYLGTYVSVQNGVYRTFDKFIARQTKRGNGYPVWGILFEGVMVVDKGKSKIPHFLEFNTRWGDPEAQVLVPGYEFDLFEFSESVASKKIPPFELTSDGKTRVAVAGVPKGYPRDYSDIRGKEITGIEAAKSMEGVTVYGSAVAKNDEGKYFAEGTRRLFTVVGEGDNVLEAQGKAYEGLQHISIKDFDGDELLYYRKDIADKEIERRKTAGKL